MSTRRVTIAVLAMLATTLALVPGAPAQALTGDGWYRIVNIKSGQALQGSTDQNGAAVVQLSDTSSSAYPGYTNPYQDWHKEADGSYFRFRNAANSTWAALTVSSTVASTTKPIILWTNNASNGDQLWQLISTGVNNTYTLKNPKSGKCLAIPGASTAPGVQAIIWTCNGGSEQKWWITDGA